MSRPEVVADALELLGDRGERDWSIASASTYRVGGPAAAMLVADDVADLVFLSDVVRATGVDVLVVGNGSNLLVADSGFPGIAVQLGDGMAEIAIDGTSVVAGAAALLPVVARQTVRAGLTGFEWAVGVPGSIGGAVRMNAGGHGSEMANSLRGVRVFDLRTGEDAVVPPADLDLRYRRSSLTGDQVVVSVELGLAPGDRAAGEDELSDIVRWRRANQPGGQNAGSVFTNPADDSAGRLIEVAGCKGRRHGTAMVSDKHANFIQADPDGSADDVFALMVEVRDAVADATGVRLHPETVLVGFDSQIFA
ncbi:UDP-N-acetylmuramate dehydrogenase [Actinospongicola halichondriae]|uniref:UDP-N-acetylmuramate dehydrogenase n=1 Tax=Actinospongicola halichondriae TaxID=3236844 RepID=UPI003D5CBEE9